MSVHEVTIENMKYVFGWDPPLQTFFLQVHDLDLDEESNLTHWYGAAAAFPLYELEDLVGVARNHNLVIDHEMQVTLYKERDEGL